MEDDIQVDLHMQTAKEAIIEEHQSVMIMMLIDNERDINTSSSGKYK